MNLKISRRNFLGLSLVGILSACSLKFTSRRTSTATRPNPTETIDTMPHTYNADDPNILYSGRIDFSFPQRPIFSAPGIAIQARFHGTGAMVLFEDEFKWGTNRNYYDAVIDGNSVVKIAPEKGVNRYEVALELPDAEHSLTQVKRTEAGIGSTTFLGFECNGVILPAPARPTRRFEFIGDSITCGTGMEALINTPQCSQDG